MYRNALEVNFQVMRSLNSRFTYLLLFTYLLKAIDEFTCYLASTHVGSEGALSPMGVPDL